MAKYEIMLVVDGSLDDKTAKSSISELIKLIEKSDNFKVTELGLKDLAYQINGQAKGWYFQYNFETNIPSIINEFRRLTLINKAVLRHLIINLEKDYGWKAINNPKKVKISEIKGKKFKEKMARLKLEREEKEKARAEFAQMQSKEATNE